MKNIEYKGKLSRRAQFASLLLVSTMACSFTSTGYAFSFDSLKKSIGDAAESAGGAIGSLTGSKDDKSTKEQQQEVADNAAGTVDDIETLQIQQEQIVQQYVIAILQMSKAQVVLLESLGLKEEAAKLRTENEALKSKNTIDKTDLKRHAKVSASTNRILEKRLNEESGITGDSRRLYAQALVDYYLGIQQSRAYYYALEPYAQNSKAFIQQATVYAKANPLTGGTMLVHAKTKLDTSLYLATDSPKFIGMHLETFELALSYGKTHKLERPEVKSGDLDFI